ncbi:MAG: protein-glutamate O-methyltransferase CheR [Planctomycetia bacterium]|nr:protein-glutamate O-methyltransferase CheR [Planctomycetia bacterium]
MMELTAQAFGELRGLIQRLCGVALSADKEYLVRHRLEPVARAAGCTGFEELLRKLRGPEAQAISEAVVEAITTSETSFFRDGQPFEAVRRLMLPDLGERLLARKSRLPLLAGPTVRLWSAATATGQEAYSLAILVHDYVEANRSRGLMERDFSILATDVSASVLARARSAAYRERELARGLTPGQVARYLQRSGDHWLVREPVRRLVDFARANLIEPPFGLGPFDVIFCRNVLIYFDESTRQRICLRLHELLKAGGWLVLGAAESLYGLTDRFDTQPWEGALLYRKPPTKQ